MKIKFLLILLILASFAYPAFAAKPTPPPPIPNSVCIDAGHGGSDTGAVNQDLTEKDINLQSAFLLKTKLETAGYTVFMTRVNDVSLSNADRYNYCNSQKASILISIHHNSSSNSSMDYSQALYMKKSDVELAREVVSAVSSALNLPNNGISRFASGVLLKANMPAAISEGFFLTNNSEYTFLTASSDRLNQEADALLGAINFYFSK